MDLLDTTDMWLPHIHSILAQSVDNLQVIRKHIGVLIIFAGDVLLDGGGEAEAVGFAEGQKEDVADVKLGGYPKEPKQPFEGTYDAIVS